MAKKKPMNESDVAKSVQDAGDFLIELDIAQGEGGSEAPALNPVSILDETLSAKLSQFLTEELDSVEGERESREKQWSEWRRMRLAQPENESKSSPWPNASNVEVPTMQSKINLVYSKFNRAFSSKDPFWTASTSRPELKEAAKALTKYLGQLAKNPYGLALSNRRREILYDCITFGTQVVRVPWLTQKRLWMKANETATGGPEATTMTVHNGPAIVPIKIEDFYIHPYWDDVQRAPWCAIRHRMTLEELRQREAMGIYENVDAILGNNISELTENETDQLRRRGMTAEPNRPTQEFQLWDIFEVRVFWDINGDGVLEDCILYFEKGSGVFLRSEYNPLPFRDIVALRFIKIPGEFYGLGEGEILQHLQKEITSTHNRRADNQTLSMQQVWVQKKGTGNIEGDVIEPGRIIKLNEIGDLQPFQFPDLSQSAMQSESIARAYADEASGASSPLAGIADPTMKSGAGASSTMFLAQQSGDLLASVSDNLSDDFSEIGRYVVMQLVANLDVAPESSLSAEETAALGTILAIPIEDLPTKLQIDVQTSDISQTKDGAKQNLLAMTQIYTGYATQMVPLVQQFDQMTAGGANMQALSSPSGRMMASVIVGATDMMSKVLEHFGVEDWENYLPATDDLKAIMAMLDGQIKQTAASIGNQVGGGNGAVEMGGMGGMGPGGMPGQLGGAGFGAPGQPGVAPGFAGPM